MTTKNIILTTNEHFIMGAYGVICSLLNHSSNNQKFHFYIITTGISAESIKTIQSIKTKITNFEHTIVNIEPYIYDTIKNIIPDVFDFSKTKKITNRQNLIIYYVRLFVASLIPVNKALYLDCDTLVVKPINDFYNTNINDYYAVAVLDFYFKDRIELKNNIKNYFNVGVMLLNLKKWREDNIEERLLKRLKIEGILELPEQDIINFVLHQLDVNKNYTEEIENSKVKIVSNEYNLYVYNDETATKFKNSQYTILHFIGPKPWRMWKYESNPKAWQLYWYEVKKIYPVKYFIVASKLINIVLVVMLIKSLVLKPTKNIRRKIKNFLTISKK